MADKDHWMQDAFKNAGKPGHSLHAALHVPSGKPIPAGKENKALHSSDTHVRRMAQLAKNANPGKFRYKGAHEK